ncbi:MAG TPA: carbohydrate-binding protein, partial [Sedimentisphaerales bacterium]|nr:carbohydrate-binding protein [Sedimentisphaerales bacterium]
MKLPVTLLHSKTIKLIFILFSLFFQNILLGNTQIIVGESASDMECYASRELQRYLYQLTSELPTVVQSVDNINIPTFVIGTQLSNSLLASFVSQGLIVADLNDPGPQGYVIKKITYNGQPVIAILGGDNVGVMYGVYGLLEDHYGIGFYFSGDAIGEPSPLLSMPDVDERKAPEMYIRGFLPWTNFHQSSTVYSWEDWKYIIDQMAKMRMNFLLIHNYNAEAGHNEMFHNFTLNGITSRVWMATAKTGHGWGCPGWNLSEYLFGAGDLFDDYDFGASCALYNENLSNLEIFAKGVGLFQRVIDYAHSRGVKIGLGLDINIIMPDYVGYSGTDSAVVNARVNQIATDYPDLDYLFCFKSENVSMTKEAWQSCFMKFYNGLHTRCPDIKIAASGWGIDSTWVAPLPSDVIAAPIAPYSATWEDGSAFGTREFWACPWMERDFSSSEYFYPYNIDLSDTIQNYQSRTANTKGLYCLTWRITDAIDPKLSYIAKAPWDQANIYTSSHSVYQEYAIKNYGTVAGQMVADIIDQNEPFASNFGECEGTYPFDGISSTAGSIFNVYWFKFYSNSPQGVSPIYASSCSSMNNVTKYSASEGGQCLGSISQGSWFKFNAISFDTEPDSFQVRIASDKAGGGRLEIRLDSLDGPVIGTCIIRETDGWQNWQNISIPVSSVSGTHAVYFKALRPDDITLASQQIALIDAALAQTDNETQQAKLKLLKCRIAAAKAYIELDLGGASTSNLEVYVNLMGQLVRNFTHRV